MPINFPTGPVLNDTYTYNGRAWIYDGTGWKANATDTSIPDGDKGDITVSSSGSVWNIDASAVGPTELATDAVETAKIDDDAVTNAKLANVATSTLKGRLTAATGDVEDLTIGNGFYSSGTTLSALGTKNLLINGCFRFNQRAPATNADDSYAHDRWNILTQTNTVAATTQTLVENGLANMMRITQSQASAQRFGVEQIIEASNTYPLRGQSVTLSARVRMSASTTLRYAILEWTGTADSPVSDVVNDWTSGTFTTGNFFKSTTMAVTATGSTALTANTLANISLTGTLSSSVTNAIVMFWTDSTQAQNVTLDVGNAQLELGSVATTLERRPVDMELAMCQRYYEKSYDTTTAIGTATEAGRISWFAGSTSSFHQFPTSFAVEKRITAAVALYSPTTGASGKIDSSGDRTAKIDGNGTRGFTGTIDNVSLSNVFAGYHFVADAEL